MTDEKPTVAEGAEYVVFFEGGPSDGRTDKRVSTDGSYDDEITDYVLIDATETATTTEAATTVTDAATNATDAATNATETATTTEAATTVTDAATNATDAATNATDAATNATETATTTEAVNPDVKSWVLGANYTMGRGKLLAGFGRKTPDGQPSTKQLSLGYEYSLSKRTYLYIDAARKEGAVGTTTNSTTINHYDVGVNHSF